MRLTQFVEKHADAEHPPEEDEEGRSSASKAAAAAAGSAVSLVPWRKTGAVVRCGDFVLLPGIVGHLVSAGADEQDAADSPL